MSKTKIVKCSCEHNFQDRQYGIKKRVHNYGEKSYRGGPGWRCTVCSSVKAYE